MKLLILDGNSILNRAFYGIKMLSTKKGILTNAIYGFMTTLHKLNQECHPDAIGIAFDVREPTFRHKSYSGYKSNRKGMPDELAQQMPILKRLLISLGYKLITCPGFEADDILGTLAKKCDEQKFDCIIATGDRDLLQLVSKHVTVRITSTKYGKTETEAYNEKKIAELYGVMPIQLIEIKALQGDTSDNIPGVKGIGEKTAKDLIQKYGSIDHIYNNINSLNIKENLLSKLVNGKESAYISKELGTIITNAPIDTDINKHIPSPPDIKEAKGIMTELEFFSLIEKLGLDNKNIDLEETENNIHEIFKTNNLDELYNEVKSEKKLFFITSFSEKKIKNFYILIGDKVYKINREQPGFKEFLKSCLEDKGVEKYTYNIKNLYSSVKEYNIEIQSVKFDIVLAAYLLNPSLPEYSISKICSEYNQNLPKISNYVDLDGEEELAGFAYIIKNIIKVMDEKIREYNLSFLLEKIEQPLAEALSDMENIGFYVDGKGIKEYSEILSHKIEQIKNDIFKLTGFEFNINSPKQLGIALFEDLGFPKGKKTKSGYSTSAEVLEGLINYHPIIKMILDFRASSKLKSAYCDGMVKLIDVNGRVHSSFNQTETRTGRISSLEPNLQNIPVKTEEGRMLRKYFCAEKGHVLVDADYSQIELRVLAHISQDENMINAFKNDEDIHTITASQILGIPTEMVTSPMRTRAKAVNFGIIYGIGAFSLSKDLGITVKDANKYINSYLFHYKGVDEYMKKVSESARENGFVETLFHRRRYLPEITSSNFNLRSFGERVARNMPIQGTAADIIKIAMVNVYKKLKNDNLKSRIILQVHDELIVEAPESEENIICDILKNEMENAIQISVPMLVHISSGRTWYDTKG